MNPITFKFNMESFYFSTHLPIKAFSSKGNEYYSVGRPDGQRTVGMRNPLSSHQELLKLQNLLISK